MSQCQEIPVEMSVDLFTGMLALISYEMSSWIKVPETRKQFQVQLLQFLKV